MKAIIAVLLFYFTINCSSPNKPEEKASVAKRATNFMEESIKIEGCKNFTVPADCVMAKEINTTLAYYLGSKNDTQKISISKLDPSSLPITKIKNSDQLSLYKKKIKDVEPKTSQRYFDPKPGDKIQEPSVQDLVQYIQDEQEGNLQGKTPVQMRNERIALQEELDKKRKEEEERLAQIQREKILKEIAAFPYTIELYCFSNITDEKVEMNDCASKLKPSLKITIPSENKVYANFSKADFMAGTLTNGNIKLPKDFNVDLLSEGLDSSTLFQVIIRERVPPWEKEAQPKFVLGQKFNIVP